MVEQRNHNPLVGGPNPSAATKIQTVRKGGFNFGIVVADKDPHTKCVGIHNPSGGYWNKNFPHLTFHPVDFFLCIYNNKQSTK